MMLGTKKRDSQSIFKYIPLTNRVLGPYCKLRTEFFPLRFVPKCRPLIVGEKRGSVTYGTDQEDEVSNILIFIISLWCV